MRIRHVQADHYVIPLPTVLSDSTHGTIRGFELVTVRLHDADGAVGVGYTYTVGTGGAAVHALVARTSPRCWPDTRPSASRRSGRPCGGPCTTAAAAAPRRSPSRPSTSRSGTCAPGARGRRSGACWAASTRAYRVTRAGSISTCPWTRSCDRPTTI